MGEEERGLTANVIRRPAFLPPVRPGRLSVVSAGFKPPRTCLWPTLSVPLDF